MGGLQDVSDRSGIQFKVIDAATGEGLGWVGCWKSHWLQLGPSDVEYPKGNMLRCNDWQLDLLYGLA